MADIARGIREVEVLTDYLNDIIVKTGRAIEHDNHSLWKKFFHHYNNDDWDNIISAMEEIQAAYPDAFERFHSHAIFEAREVLTNEASRSQRIMDTRPYKNKAWKAAMAVREVINNLNGIRIPNEPSQH
jgi:hypothetical protein